MTVAIEFVDGDPVVWERPAEATPPGEPATAVPRRDPDYEPAFLVAGPSRARARLADWLAGDDRVTGTATRRRYRSLADREGERMLRVGVRDPAAVRSVARRVRRGFERAHYAPGTLRLFDVDLDPTFRYCLDTGARPVPDAGDADLTTLRVDLPEDALAAGDAGALRIGGDPAAPDGDERAAIETLHGTLARRDPDALVVSDGDLLPVVAERADDLGVSFRWGRHDERQVRRVAGANSYESYGRVGFSPARYVVPGRAVVDRSGSFLWGDGGLEGLVYFARRSRRPLQATARASIGGVLTSMQVYHARGRGVHAPWRPWTPERFKPLSTLHDADRGGVTVSPRVGVHEDVVEVDFASLYPAVIRAHNVSPETVRCDCCRDGDPGTGSVPNLGYRVCDREGFLPGVLGRLLDDRATAKAFVAGGDDTRRRIGGDAVDPAGAGRIADAIKWVLVSCFGYQGYRNAKFGRIECHEAINAHAREALLDAKAAFEAGGWRVLHAIVDSVWVARDDDRDPVPARELAADVSDAVGVALEFEARYDWVCFVPKRDSRAGALTKYFGRRADGGVRVRGIECRQRSTTAFVADAQREMIRALDGTAQATNAEGDAGAANTDPDADSGLVEDPPAAACRVLAERLRDLRTGGVDPADLVIRTRASKDPEAYDRDTTTAAALARYERAGVDRSAGQTVAYVVVDDDARGADRVRLDFESPGSYDADAYRERLLRAALSVVSPFGWDREDVTAFLADGRNARLSAY
ncbi:DNA polymerase domain-containing protein [Halobaculum magnesiiphilum]|uniref:DNA-directed DNA polymerase n=1 Tax=Halobaculum magnesiiphilum TaxID=1017351 RepID=A0A8T8WBZ2_9EURY|nr:DNA polymerase domain-containing protein [Halobaculum magnesiiphilum]QZP37368.1 DNA polymerase I [Halobaculum magnesiiphilum]